MHRWVAEVLINPGVLEMLRMRRTPCLCWMVVKRMRRVVLSLTVKRKRTRRERRILGLFDPWRGDNAHLSRIE